MKKFIICLVIGVICFGFGWYLKKPETNTKIIFRQSDTQKELAKINELEGKIEEYKEIIDSLKLVKEKVKVLVKEKIVEVKNLPPDSGVILLKENLVTYGELTEESDSLPKLLEDSTAQISQNNVKDINIICTRYEGALEENQILNSELQVTSEVITKKDSIIQIQDTINKKTVVAYEEEIGKEKKKKKIWIGVSSGLALVIGLILAL